MCADVEADGVSLSLDFSSLRPLLTGATATPAPGPCFMKPDEPTEPTTPTEPTEPTTQEKKKKINTNTNNNLSNNKFYISK